MTLNEIIKRIKTICEAHEQINSFVFGDIDDRLRGDITYPCVFMPYPSVSITGADESSSCSLFFMDKVIMGGASTDNTFNELEVSSDMLSVAKDILAQFNYQKFSPVWKVDRNATFTLTNEVENDYIAGVQMEFTIKSQYLGDRCQVPTTYSYGN